MLSLKILIVEDDKLIAKDISLLLSDWGYQVVGMATNATDAIQLFETTEPDLALIDVNINGTIDGIATAQHFNTIRKIPIVFLTGQTDYHTIERAKTTFPAAYLLKPFDEQNLHICIDMALNNFYSTSEIITSQLEDKQLINNDVKLKSDNFLRKDDCVFIKNNFRFIKLSLCDIYYMEADGNHTKIVAKGQKIMVRLPLASVIERLSDSNILRIHRSFAINMLHVDEFDDAEVVVQGKSVPFANTYKKHFFNNFKIF